MLSETGTILARAKWLYRQERGEIWTVEGNGNSQFLDRAERELLHEGSIDNETGDP
jgi:hypothetical protein